MRIYSDHEPCGLIKFTVQYVGVLYENGMTTTFNYGECYPYSLDGVLAEMAVFCKSVTCENNP